MAQLSDDDCDDEDAAINPDAAEIEVDGVDQNCDGNDLDQDEDGFDAADYGGDDCNDLDATMYPGGPPTLAGVDNDCNGYILGLEQLGGGCPGDLNGDGIVTIQDLLTFLNDFGNSGFLEADLNFDQHVGVADLLLMLGLLGNDC